MLRYIILIFFHNFLNIVDSKSCEKISNNDCLENCQCSLCFYNLSGDILETCVTYDLDNGGCGSDSIYQTNKYTNFCQKDEILFRMIFFTFAGIFLFLGCLIIVYPISLYIYNTCRRINFETY